MDKVTAKYILSAMALAKVKASEIISGPTSKALETEAAALWEAAKKLDE